MAGEKQPGETLEGLRKARRTRRMFGRTRYVTEAGSQWINDSVDSKLERVPFHLRQARRQEDKGEKDRGRS